jgi:hypothetical protein
MKHWWLAALFAACALIAGLFCARPSAREPVYAGRPVSEWLDGGYEQISMAMHETGPSAAPVIFSKLRRDHPVYGSRAKYRRLWSRAPEGLQRFLPRPKAGSFDELTACNALLDIGPAVIPYLATGLEDPNEGVRLVSALALSQFCQRGSNIQPALPSLARATRDRNTVVRQEAASMLASVGTQTASGVKPVFGSGL